jgi:hypothetical protein
MNLKLIKPPENVRAYLESSWHRFVRRTGVSLKVFSDPKFNASPARFEWTVETR